MSHSQLSPADAYAELGRIELRDATFDQVIQRIADVAKRAIPGAAEVSVTIVRAQRPTTVAATGPAALALDEAQYATGRGPCVDAAQAGQLVLVEDVSVDDRWPAFAVAARREGMTSSLSVALPVQQDVVGGLNIYADRLGVFDAQALETVRTFAAYAAVAVANATLYLDTAALARQMQEAMESRAVIEQAKGILMAERRCTATEAFDLLVAISQATHRKVRELADDLVRTTAAPRP